MYSAMLSGIPAMAEKPGAIACSKLALGLRKCRFDLSLAECDSADKSSCVDVVQFV